MTVVRQLPNTILYILSVRRKHLYKIPNIIIVDNLKFYCQYCSRRKRRVTKTNIVKNRMVYNSTKRKRATESDELHSCMCIIIIKKICRFIFYERNQCCSNDKVVIDSYYVFVTFRILFPQFPRARRGSSNKSTEIRLRKFCRYYFVRYIIRITLRRQVQVLLKKIKIKKKKPRARIIIIVAARNHERLLTANGNGSESTERPCGGGQQKPK